MPIFSLKFRNTVSIVNAAYESTVLVAELSIFPFSEIQHSVNKWDVYRLKNTP